jgi:quercetin dioxygenase-like cupin family protein
MNETLERALTITVRHTGERLVLHRARNNQGVEELHLSGSLPPRQEGPPLHIHTLEDEHGEVLAGTLSIIAGGNTSVITAGGRGSFPRGSAHRWWNAGTEEVVFRGVATPLADLDRFLQALFEVINAGDGGRPPIFYLAHVLFRHRKTQTALVMPRAIQPFVLRLIVLVGTVLGKYRGISWPGCPARCSGAPYL